MATKAVKAADVSRIRSQAQRSMVRFSAVESRIFKKKVQVTTYKEEDRVEIYCIADIPTLIKSATGEVGLPVALALMYNNLLKSIYVDDGAVRAILNGADLKVPGIKRYSEEFAAGECLQLCLLDSDIPFATGIAVVGSKDCVPGRKGDGVKVISVLRDRLWSKRAK